MAIEYSISSMNMLSDGLFVKDDDSKNLTYLLQFLKMSIELGDVDDFQRILIKIKERYHLKFIKQKFDSEQVENAKDLSTILYIIGSFCIKNEYWEALDFLIMYLNETLEHISNLDIDYDEIFLAAEVESRGSTDQQELFFIIEYLAAFDFLLFVKIYLRKTESTPLFSMYPESRDLVELTHEKNFFELDENKFKEISELIDTVYSDFQETKNIKSVKTKQLAENQKEQNSKPAFGTVTPWN